MGQERNENNFFVSEYSHSLTLHLCLLRTKSVKYTLSNEQEMLDFSAKIAGSLSAGDVVFLQGNLGAGKTTVVRGILQYYGYSGAVKSPTYTLVEPYSLNGQKIYHFDLYRLGDPEELEYMGGRDYFDSNSICLVEWPEKADGFLPEPSLTLLISYYKEGRKVLVS